MIQFRCWFCNRLYSLAEKHIGETRICSCERRLRVPRRDFGNSRSRTVTDWLIEIVVYGFGGMLAGLGLATLIISQWHHMVPYEPYVAAGLMLMGGLLGLFGGEKGIVWLGRLIKDREQR